MEKKNKNLKCFISAPFGEDIKPIISILKDNDVDVISPFDLEYQPISIFDQVKKEMRKSDFIIVVLPAGGTNENLFLELGIAIGLGKKVILFAPPNSIMPYDSKNFLTIQSSPDNSEAFQFLLEQIKEISFKKEKSKTIKRKSGKPLGAKANLYLDKIEYGINLSEYQLVEIVKDIFYDVGIKVLSESKNFKTNVDMAIWSDYLNSYLGNPIIIEIKRRLTNVDKITSQIRNYLSLSNSKSAIIISFDKEKNNADVKSFADPSIFYLNIFDLLEDLKESTFEDIIIKMRNRRIHRGEF